MRAYGYPRSAHRDALSSPTQSQGIELHGIVIEVDKVFLVAFRDFVQYALDDMHRLGDAYGHVHFQDKCKRWRDDWPDIVLIKRDTTCQTKMQPALTEGH